MKCNNSYEKQVPMLMTYFSRISHKLQDRVFSLVHGNRLVYNTCWEDPRLDRELLDFSSDSRIVMITSAGDNALAYIFWTIRPKCIAWTSIFARTPCWS